MDLAVRVHSISTVPTVPTEEETQQTEFEMTPQFCLRFQNRDVRQSLKSVETYEVPFFNISLLKDWIQNCTDSHGAACEGKIQAEPDELPQGFRVINLDTMNVEEPATTLSYVALSYMWPSEKGLEHVQLERSNLHMLEQPSGLDQIALPPVITDTMLLCKQLGENYLWVDRFRTTDPEWYLRREPVNYHITHDTSEEDYLVWVANYTSRQLSIGSDILNAFAGISGILGQMIGSDCIFGFPEKFLLQALMWTASDNIKMRVNMPANIPSWSRASSPSKVDYEWITERKKDCLRVISLVYFHFQDPEEELRRVKAQEWWVEREMPIEDFGSRDDVPTIETISTKYLPAHWRTNRTWKEWCPHNPWQTLLHTTLSPEACRAASNLPGALVFNTTVATLTLDPPTAGEFKQKGGLYIRSFMNGLSEKYDEWSDKIGTIYGPFPRGLDSKKLSEKKQDVIVICGALEGAKSRRTGIRWGIPPGFNMWRLHVMLIERDEARPFIARRVGVGYVQAHMWEDFDPRWETVVLC
ncbi:HET domain-containing protein [Fusarium sp. LHS14.1]|nr:HET domain-containing protein [Fusarium sp. LHS14.1]